MLERISKYPSTTLPVRNARVDPPGAFAPDTKPADVPKRLQSAVADWTRALQRTSHIKTSDRQTLFAAIDELAIRQPERVALMGENETVTYAELVARTRQYAAWAYQESLGPGDVVALMMSNRIDYVAIWLGLSRRGIVTALLNTQLVGDALRNSIALAKPRHIIVDDDHLAQLRAAAPCRLPVSLADAHDQADDRDAIAASDLDVKVQLSEQALLIYTSGTTGLPKAARVSHYRIRMWSEWFAGIMNATPDDRLYNCLPMYHSVGGVVAIGAMLIAGGTVIVRKSFSSIRFWPDVISSGATIFQYIGELCRYLLQSSPAAGVSGHRLRLCCGNGLRIDVWSKFQAAFHIPRIIEFYAATEGSFSLFNLEGQPGAVGRIPSFMAHRSPAALVRFNHDRGEPKRDEDGRCIRCGPDEIGEAIGRLSRNTTDLATRFEGYTNTADSEKKILRGVFAADDAWFRTGDLMRRDKEGFYYFVDRIGDTFRWKGENVSTAEVADVLLKFPGLTEAAVFGVELPFADGRPGMAALVAEADFRVEDFRRYAESCLPQYAIPVFLRICSRLAHTGSFKVRKADLIAESFNVSNIRDPLFVSRGGTYLPLCPETYGLIQRGELRL